MELEINKDFAQHYNSYRAKEEAAKTKKILKSEIKQLEESSSSSSDSEYEECYKMKYIQQCDNILRKIEKIDKITSKIDGPLYDEIIVDVAKDKVEKPVYAKDLNRLIILDGGMENEKELLDIEKYSKLDSEDILNLVHKDGMNMELDNGQVSEDDDFFKPSKKAPMFVCKPSEKNVPEELESDIESQEEADIVNVKTTNKIEINRDRKLETVRVSKTTSRAEKRKNRKEKKDKEIKEKMKRLQELKNTNLMEKLEKIKKNAPEMAKYLTLQDMDEDFDIDEYSKKLASIYEQDGSDLPEDTEKPVFSDDSDMEFGAVATDPASDGEEATALNGCHNEVGTKKISKKAALPKKNASYFTNLDMPTEDSTGNQKKVGIVRKTGDNFDRTKYRDYGNYLKKTFDICCEDLIMGRDDADDVKCRFRYRKVEEQTFGLDMEDIILADNKELNSWASLKKITRIRTEADEARDRRKYGLATMQEKKREVLASLYRPEEDDRDEEEVGVEENNMENDAGQTTKSKSSKKRLRKIANKKLLKETIAEEVDIDEPISKKAKTQLDGSTEVKEETPQESTTIKKSKKKEKSDEVSQESSVIKKSKKKEQSDEVSQESSVIKKSKKSKKRESEKEEQNGQKSAKTKKKTKSTSVPVLNANRLEALGIKPGYYKHVMCDPKNKH